MPGKCCFQPVHPCLYGGVGERSSQHRHPRRNFLALLPCTYLLGFIIRGETVSILASKKNPINIVSHQGQAERRSRQRSQPELPKVGMVTWARLQPRHLFPRPWSRRIVPVRYYLDPAWCQQCPMMGTQSAPAAPRVWISSFHQMDTGNAEIVAPLPDVPHCCYHGILISEACV